MGLMVDMHIINPRGSQLGELWSPWIDLVHMYHMSHLILVVYIQRMLVFSQNTHYKY